MGPEPALNIVDACIRCDAMFACVRTMHTEPNDRPLCLCTVCADEDDVERALAHLHMPFNKMMHRIYGSSDNKRIRCCGLTLN